MSRPPRGYAQSTEILQPAERVFAAFTEKATLERWYAAQALVEPWRGGAFRVQLRDGRVRDATIDVWDAGRRLRLIYMPDAEFPSTGGPLVEDVLFDAKQGRTFVRVLGHGVPGEREWDAYFAWLTRGWTYWLHGLKRLLEAGPAGEARG